MCGIAGIVAHGEVNQELYDALTILQHRGQDAAGIVTTDGQRVNLRKDNGLVRDVFQQRHMQRLLGHYGIGHVRYPTAGTSSNAEAQPMYVNSPYGIALAHNGNLTNAERLRTEVFRDDLRHMNTDSDSEVLLNVFAHELLQVKRLQPTPDDIFRAVNGVHRRCQGAYAVVALIVGVGIVGFRDPLGIRPLVLGRRKHAEGAEYMLASESVALDLLGFEMVGDVAPGEAIFITEKGELRRQVCAERTRLVPCIFEHVYLARPDSIMDGVSVYKARLRMGEYLAARILERYPGGKHDIDVVIPIPETSRTCAMPLAQGLDTRFREGFVKNRYIPRTFIMPGQQERRRSVRHKFNTIPLEFQDKNVLLVDDSIVRGTTIGHIVQMARDAGARKVYVASAAPMVRFPNVYGIDLAAAEEFVARVGDVDAIAREIGADWLIYQRLDDLVKAAQEGNSSIRHFECSVFDGNYVTGDIDDSYLKRLSLRRNDATKQSSNLGPRGNDDIPELHNHA
ncbi:MAG: amidophosphoribosyltransferase [Pseudomonadales bacterium]|nr:amidophosphoribosyltransferase [Pseudomonadales bacterium]MCP5183975.1 amidophosphoribosyltransferase [Pseudomonadales bacterium]